MAHVTRRCDHCGQSVAKFVRPRGSGNVRSKFCTRPECIAARALEAGIKASAKIDPAVADIIRERVTDCIPIPPLGSAERAQAVA